MKESNNNLIVRSYIPDYNKSSKFIESDGENYIHEKDDGTMVAGLYQKNKTNIFSFLMKIFIVIQLVWISQFSYRNNAFEEAGIENYKNFNNNGIVRNSRILVADLLKDSLASNYEILETNVMNKLESIYEAQSKNIGYKILAFFQKLDLLFEREIIRIFKYIEKEKEKPIKNGIQFFNSLKVFFSGLKLFSAPIIAAVNSLLIYYFKPQLIGMAVSIGLNIIPTISFGYVLYKIYKVNLDMQKKKSKFFFK
ncbi:hypothetical protein YYG_04787 [Plasmodium vinckei petteri]|uniref:Uncharacterized protein n=1 Tax=Plasmodium vinckei petteri TaxID=138298 RepID=W7AF62_PLAVN|nr:hypothetical protein YYG_04787 [Plasmodium vinckei petteri]CAD2097200.1 Plasmodium exported protein, unknown function [Plasmodium vinckei petteri]